MIQEFLNAFRTGFSARMFHSLYLLMPIWLPLILIATWYKMWMHWKQRAWLKNEGEVLLEVKLSKDMLKSPQAMEIFLNTLYQTGVGSLLDVYIKGRVRPPFSLEIASIDGNIHFYIWCLKSYRVRVEANLYAQFPNIEIHEAADYTQGIHYNPERLNFGWFGQFILTRADAYPIKSYIEYGLDKNEKEEYKNDPLVSLLEFFGALKKGEQAWLQIMIRAHTKEGLKYGRFVPKPDWKGGVEKEIKSILSKANLKISDEKAPSGQNLSEGQRIVIAAIDRAAGKNAFDTMIRGAYIAEPAVFDKNKIGGFIGSVTQFGSSAYNGFKPGFNKGKNDYPWQDFGERRKTQWTKELLEAYKRRSFFYPPFKHFHNKPYILSTEELATLWHFPSGTVAATPTLTRIPSRKAEAPANLPV